jgi:hypothetical protein
MMQRNFFTVSHLFGVARLSLTSRMLSLLLLVVLLQHPTTISAFPTAPGGCPAGTAATTGHPVPNPVPSFADLGYELLVDGKVVAGNKPVLEVGSRYEFAVRATDKPFRGALIRVEGLGTLEAGQKSALALLCVEAPGVGHTENSEKTILSGFYEVVGGGAVTLDVTVVQGNALGVSVYSYERFQFSVEAPTVKAPVAVPLPIQAPVVLPTKKPVVAPTKAPIVPPTMKPVVAPTEAPIVPPTTKPVVAPTKAPAPALAKKPVVVVPINAPFPAPTNLLTKKPVAVPTPTAVATPTMQPVVATTNAPVVTNSSAFSDMPSDMPSDMLSDVPSDAPSGVPTNVPTNVPTRSPSRKRGHSMKKRGKAGGRSYM